MGVRSFMMSYLATRSVALADRFPQQHAGPWLVWEPGEWRPAGSAVTTMVSGKESEPKAGDALCFQLGGLSKEIRVGRETACDLVINDATVSRHHVTLHATPVGWEIEAMKDTGVVLDGQPLARGQRRVLRWGAALSLGAVRLSLYDDFGFVQRLRS
ncbi:MAG: FHA domain-containing protein [Archangium sp.]